jgi:benzoylformate decarboxylase
MERGAKHLSRASAAQEGVAVLRANGIDRVFGNPGTTELPFLAALAEARVPFHLGLHEGIATAMADGYARATGTVGTVTVHMSVGTANTVSQLINARSDRVPLLVIAGDKDDRLYGRGSFVEVPDVAGLVRQVTKAAWRVSRPEKFPELVYRGLKVAQAAPQGPVFLSVPENYFGEPLPAEREDFVRAAPRLRSRCAEDDLGEVLRRIAAARAPLLIAGNEVGRSGNAQRLARLAEALAVPVVTEEVFTTAWLNFPWRHDLYHGCFRAALEVVRSADLVVAIGARLFLEYAYPDAPRFAPGAEIIEIQSDPDEIAKIHASSGAILCDVGDAIERLARLLESVPPIDSGTRAARLARTRRGRRPSSEPRRSGARMALGEAIRALAAAMPPQGVIVDESVLSKGGLLERFDSERQPLYFGTSGAALGWGVGAALGVQLALPDKRVVAFIGDGAALFSIQGLWTAAHLRLPVVFFVVNNQGYMAVRRGLEQLTGTSWSSERWQGAALERPPVDFCGLAHSQGVAAYQAADPGTLAEALERAFSQDGPVLIDALVAPEEYLDPLHFPVIKEGA